MQPTPGIPTPMRSGAWGRERSRRGQRAEGFAVDEAWSVRCSLALPHHQLCKRRLTDLPLALSLATLVRTSIH